MRIGISITTARRRGWKLYFFEEPEESALFSGGYIQAVRKGEYPPVQVLGGFMGRSIGSRRYGVIRDTDLEKVLEMFEVDPASLFGFGVGKGDAPTRSR